MLRSVLVVTALALFLSSSAHAQSGGRAGGQGNRGPAGYGYPGSGYPGSGYPGSGYPGSGYPGYSYPGYSYPGYGYGASPMAYGPAIMATRLRMLATPGPHQAWEMAHMIGEKTALMGVGAWSFGMAAANPLAWNPFTGPFVWGTAMAQTMGFAQMGMMYNAHRLGLTGSYR